MRMILHLTRRCFTKRGPAISKKSPDRQLVGRKEKGDPKAAGLCAGLAERGMRRPGAGRGVESCTLGSF